MKKTLLAATSLLALAAFGAQASEDHKAAEAAKDAVKAEATATTTEAGKTDEGTATEAAPAAGEAKKEEKK